MERRTLLGIIATALGTIAWRQPQVMKPYLYCKGALTANLEEGYADPNQLFIILDDARDNGKDQTIIEYKGKAYFLKEEKGLLRLIPYERKVTIKEINQQ